MQWPPRWARRRPRRRRPRRGSSRAAPGTFTSEMSPTGRNSTDDRLLGHGVDEARRDDPHLVDFSRRNRSRATGRDGACLGKRRRIAGTRTRPPADARGRATNCAALRPAVMKTVDWPDRTARATRNTFVLSAPHRPLSAAMRITARLRTGRTSMQRMREIHGPAWSRCAGCGTAAAQTAPVRSRPAGPCASSRPPPSASPW